MNYQQQAIAGMNPVELIVALYDGMVRFLYQAIGAIEAHNVAERRTSIGRVLDIVTHLQSRLRMDVGGNSAKALSEFHTAVFALCLEGSRLESTERLKEAIGCIRDVREAWNTAAQDPQALKMLGEADGPPAGMMMSATEGVSEAEPASSSWTA
jgi:flagellar protein FliS